MDYKLNHLSDVEKEVEVTFSAEEVSENINTSLSHLSKTVSIKGFRKGKVPINVVRQFYGKNIKEDALNHFLSSGVQDTAIKEKLRFATRPDIVEQGEIKEGRDFVFKYKVETFPSVDIELKDFEAEYSPLKYKDEMLELELESLKKRFIEYSEKEEASADKDRLVISFSGTIDGEAIDGTKGDNVPAVLGEGKFVPDFEKALFDRKKNDKFEADVTFPEDYQASELAGKTVKFTIEVHKVEKQDEAPELTDEFLKGKEGYPNTVEELRTELDKQINLYIENLNSDNKKYIASDTYVKNYEFQVPPTILNNEVEHRKNEYKQKNKVEEVDGEALKKIEEDALWVTKRYIILNELSEKLNVEVTEKEVDKVLAIEAANYGLPPEYVENLKKMYGEERLAAKKMEIRESKVLDLITEKMKFIEVEKKEESEEKKDD